MGDTAGGGKPGGKVSASAGSNGLGPVSGEGRGGTFQGSRAPNPQPVHRKSHGSAPSDPQAVGGRITGMSFARDPEVTVRLEAARDHLQHGIDGDVSPAEAIHNCRRILAALDRMLGDVAA